MSTVLYKALKSAGADDKLATSAAEAMPPDVATKADLAELSAATKADFAELSAATKADFAELSAATKADFAELSATMVNMATKAELAELKSLMLWHMVIAMTAQIGVFVALIKLL